MEYEYCRRCGKKLSLKNNLYICENGHNIFPAPKPTTGVFFLRNSKIILSRRGIEPNKGKLDTIGGFVDLNENFEQSIKREILEETGLNQNQYGELKYLCSALGTYRYQDENRQVLSVFFTAELDKNAKPEAKDDVASIEELDLLQIEDNEVGNEDVKIALRMLKEKYA